jgi:hypothetical protein
MMPLAVQAAIDAAQAAGGGVITADGATVALGLATNENGEARQIWLNQYPTRYGLMISASNISLEDMAIVLPVAPTTPTTGLDNYSMIVFADGRPVYTPYADMRRLHNVGISRVTVDVSALSDAELSAMGEGSICGAIIFAKCDNFLCEDVTVNGSWGFTGTITVHVGSEYGFIRRCTVNGRSIPGANGSYTPIGNGIWIVPDGSEVRYIGKLFVVHISAVGQQFQWWNPVWKFPNISHVAVVTENAVGGLTVEQNPPSHLVSDALTEEIATNVCTDPSGHVVIVRFVVVVRIVG